MAEMDELLKLANRRIGRLVDEQERDIARRYAHVLIELKSIMAEQYERYEKDGVLTLEDMLKHDRLQKTMKKVEFSLKTHYKGVNGDIDKILKGIYSEGHKSAAHAIETTSKAALNFSAATPEQMQAMLNNPVAGLTLNQRLEQQRGQIVYNIQQQVTSGLQQNKPYSHMAKVLKTELEGDLVKATRIVRTEGHRVQESAKHDAMDQANKGGVITMKTWRSMEDERVRRKVKGLADHKALNGTKIAQDAMFNDGLSIGPAPGLLPAAGSSINCRCFLTYSVERVERPQHEVLANMPMADWEKLRYEQKKTPAEIEQIKPAKAAPRIQTAGLNVQKGFITDYNDRPNVRERKRINEFENEKDGYKYREEREKELAALEVYKAKAVAEFKEKENFFKDYDEAEAYIRKNILRPGSEPDIRGIDLALVSGYCRTFEQIAVDFPALKNSYRDFDSKRDPASAWTMEASNGIHFGQTTVEEIVDSTLNNKDTVGNSIYKIFIHEIGHTVDNHIRQVPKDQAIGPDGGMNRKMGAYWRDAFMRNSGIELHLRNMKKMQRSNDKDTINKGQELAKAFLSVYSAENDDEMMAELFAAAYSINAEDKEITHIFRKWLKQVSDAEKAGKNEIVISEGRNIAQAQIKADQQTGLDIWFMDKPKTEPKAEPKPQPKPEPVTAAATNWKDANNLEDMKKGFAAANGVEVEGMENFDLKTVRGILERSEKVYNKFPSIREYNKKIASYTNGGVERAHVLRSVGGSGVFYNEAHWNKDNFERTAKDQLDQTKRGHFVKFDGNDEFNAVTHEFGHIMANMLNKGEWFNYVKTNETDIDKWLKRETMKRAGLTQKDVARNLSTYGATIPQEFVAEAFTEYTESDNPRPLAKIFGEVLEELLEKMAKGAAANAKAEPAKPDVVKTAPKAAPKAPSPELLKAFTGSSSGMELFMAAGDDPKLMEELRERMKGMEGTPRQKLEVIYADLKNNHKTKVEKYAPAPSKKMADFKPGKAKFAPSTVSIAERTDGRDAIASANQDGSIVVNKAFWDLEPEQQRYIIAHEIGHVVSNAYAGLESHILDNPEGALGRLNQLQGRFEGVNNTWTPEESFADAFSLYHTDRNYMDEQHPKAVEFIETILREIPDAKAFYDAAMKALGEKTAPAKREFITDAAKNKIKKFLGIKTPLDMATNAKRKKYSVDLLAAAGLDHMKVSVKKLKAHGMVQSYNRPGRDADGQYGNKRDTFEFILNSEDKRKAAYQVKTLYHEFYHANFNGLYTDDTMRLKSSDWTSWEETATETAAHFMVKEQGITEMIVPSYAKYLMENLPRLKKLDEFKDCESIEDFGAVFMKYRFDDAHKSARWADLHEAVYTSNKAEPFKIFEYNAEHYHEYILANLDEALPELTGAIDESKRNDDYYNKTLTQHIKDGIDNRKHTTGYDLAIVWAMKKIGVK